MSISFNDSHKKAVQAFINDQLSNISGLEESKKNKAIEFIFKHVSSLYGEEARPFAEDYLRSRVSERKIEVSKTTQVIDTGSQLADAIKSDVEKFLAGFLANIKDLDEPIIEMGKNAIKSKFGDSGLAYAKEIFFNKFIELGAKLSESDKRDIESIFYNIRQGPRAPTFGEHIGKFLTAKDDIMKRWGQDGYDYATMLLPKEKKAPDKVNEIFLRKTKGE
ncbi:MAG: hypothetical protein H0X29_09620 [Parachlamydiaceae bacterium]|nr:hypothetical protein [Parachlamydiaceae bacterium]